MEDSIRILIADDDSHNRLMLKHILSHINIHIIAEACNGKEAVALYTEYNPDIVLLDIMMPVMNGKEALIRIQKINPKSIIIMLTSLDDMDTVQQCIDSGATNYIIKSSPLKEIQDTILDTWSSNHG